MQDIETLKKFIIDNFDIDLDEASPDSDIGVIGVSSFDLAQIAVAVEDEFNIAISDDELYSIKTIGDILKALAPAKA